MVCNLIFIPSASAGPTPNPKPYQCPGSNAHVWDKDQCPRLDSPFGIGGRGGGGGCNLVCSIGGLLGIGGLL